MNDLLKVQRTATISTMQVRISHSLFPRLLILFALLAALKGGVELGRVLLLELHGPLHADAQLFFLVGRGMLEGLTPYVDLYEPKPPGVFFLMALSLWLTDGNALATALQCLAFLVIPIALAVWAWRETIDAPRPWRIVVTSTACAAGCLLALYAEQRAGMLLAEGFGAGFSVLAVIAMAWRGPRTLLRTLVIALGMLGAIGMKEPFVLSLFAAALLLNDHPNEFIHRFILPLSITTVVGILILAISGLFIPYLRDYLPLMLGQRIHTDIIDPLWIRGFLLHHPIGNLAFTNAPLLAIVLPLLWIVVPALRVQTAPLRETSLSILVTSCTIVIFEILYVLARLAMTLPATQWIHFRIFWPMLIIGISTLLCIAWAMVHLFKECPSLARHACIAAVALYFASLSVGVGGTYYEHHFGFILPLYAALVVLWLRVLAEARTRLRISGVIMLIFLATLLTTRVKPEHRQLLLGLAQRSSSATRVETQRLDALLDACDIDRYGTYDVRFPFARHAVLGPVLAGQRYLRDDHPLVVRTRETLKSAPIIIATNDVPDPFMRSLLNENFTTEPPPCARDSLPVRENLVAYFRKS